MSQMSMLPVLPIRVFPARTKWTPDDPLAFVGELPLFRPGTPESPIYVSAVFTWQRRRAEQLAKSWGMGGPHEPSADD
jgi:hypothetical protein